MPGNMQVKAMNNDNSLISIPATPANKKEDRFALIIYIPWALEAWITHTYKEENFSGHSMHWESIEMVNLLNRAGYSIDFANCTSHLPVISWSKYELIIDERNSIYHSPHVNGQTKIHYATGCQWLTHNLGELQRIQSFRDRHGIAMPSIRQVAPFLAESTADIVTYFGGNFQRNSFTNPEKTFRLFQTTTFNPPFKEKDVESSRYNFLWLGSKGLILKGLDVVLEAFEKRPELSLFLATSLEGEPEFFQWYKDNFSNCVNIHYCGWMNVQDKAFQEVADNCIATINCSSTEGGAGATVQAMQFGCIPVVNDVVDDSTFLKGDKTGFKIDGTTAPELISSLDIFLKEFKDIGVVELQERSLRARQYANTFHSRENYTKAFQELIDKVHG